MPNKQIPEGTQKSRKRTFRLDKFAQLMGYPTWRKYESAMIACEIEREKQGESPEWLAGKLYQVVTRTQIKLDTLREVKDGEQ